MLRDRAPSQAGTITGRKFDTGGAIPLGTILVSSTRTAASVGVDTDIDEARRTAAYPVWASPLGKWVEIGPST